MECIVHNNKDIVNRLNRINGQIGGIKSMVESNRTCEDVLTQISAVNSALHKVAQMVLEDHLGHCVSEGIKNNDKDKALHEITRSIEHFSKIR